jgi:hypothetical protein
MSTMALAFVALATIAIPATAASTPSPAACTSTRIIEITHFAFTPPTVVPGQVGTATVSAR